MINDIKQNISKKFSRDCNSINIKLDYIFKIYKMTRLNIQKNFCQKKQIQEIFLAKVRIFNNISAYLP